VSEGGRGRVFRFGVFTLEEATGELRKDGVVRPRMRDQALAILTMLLERRGELVTREELQARVWAADTFVDFEHGLNTAVNQVRVALGDEAGNPRFVQTVPRRGYRFIAPVEILEASSRGTGRAVAAEAGFGAVAVGAETNSTGFTAAAETDGSLAAADAENPTTISRANSTGLLSERSDLPPMENRRARALFLLLQVMYLGFYVVALARVRFIAEILEPLAGHAVWLMVVLIVTAAVGIPVRVYLMTATALNYAGLGGKFLRLFPFVLVLDVIWATGPFLLTPWIGMGLALASCAVLLYVPFAERSLLLMRRDS
jgi:DNA-binding winged helix-turn-helix (wHTH) protein